jgi:endogenous inhibitor of DNA gyrase (YacG/DUF329 family)
MIFQDATRRCAECGQDYTWGEQDQRFAHERGYLPPKRCPACRQAAKRRREEHSFNGPRWR